MVERTKPAPNKKRAHRAVFHDIEFCCRPMLTTRRSVWALSRSCARLNRAAFGQLSCHAVTMETSWRELAMVPCAEVLPLKAREWPLPRVKCLQLPWPPCSALPSLLAAQLCRGSNFASQAGPTLVTMDPLAKVPRISGEKYAPSAAGGGHGAPGAAADGGASGVAAGLPDAGTVLDTILQGTAEQRSGPILKMLCEALSSGYRNWRIGMPQLRKIMPILVQLAPDRQLPHEARLNALWALTNIAAGASEHTHLLIEHGALSVLVYILRQEADDLALVEQAAWALGNVSGDSAAARDAVLAAGAMQLLINTVKNSLHEAVERTNLLKIVTWAISNNFHGTPKPAIKAADTLPVMLATLQASDDAEVLSHVCWTVSHICEGSATDISDALQFDPLPCLVQLLKHESWRVLKPALRAVGNIVCAEDDGKQKLTQAVVESGAVSCLCSLVQHPSR